MSSVLRLNTDAELWQQDWLITDVFHACLTAAHSSLSQESAKLSENICKAPGDV